MRPSTQLEWLRNDIAEVRRTLDRNEETLAKLADTSDPGVHATRVVVSDLAWRMWDHAGGTEVLLREELYTSALVILRAMFDGMVTLAYLVKHDNTQREAVVLLAWSHLRDIKHFSDQPEQVSAYRAALSRIPAELVNEANRRMTTHPRTWSGKSVKDMAETAKVSGYDPGYAYMSAEAHGSAIGRHIATVPDGRQVSVEFGRHLTHREVEAFANYARRFLHASFRLMWGVFEGPKVQLNTQDPEAWDPQAT